MMNNRGRFHDWRVRWFGERDMVAAELKSIAKQGAGMARAAHVGSGLMLFLFSAGSLVSLGGDALAVVIHDWQTAGTVNIPSAVSLAVSFMLVVCFDLGMLYAAGMLRLLGMRRSKSGAGVHRIVLLGVAALEAGTYIYMSWLYEHPSSPAAWVLIIARALAAPLLSVYLSMARTLPVTARDILAQVELMSGRGVIGDIARVAGDGSATLEQKMKLFGASAIMTPEDSHRLQGLMEAATQTGFWADYPLMPPGANPWPDGGSPLAISNGGTDPRGEEDTSDHAYSNGKVVALPPKVRRAARRRRQRQGVRTVDNYEQQARAAFAAGHRTVKRMVAATGMSQSAAGGWVRTLKAEAKTGDTQAAQVAQ